MRPLSYSQISRYRECPLSYKLLYIDKLKAKEKYYLSFGDIIHQCAEYFFKVPVPPPPTLEKLLLFYQKNWISDGYESTEQEQQYKEYGRQLLADFWENHYSDFRMPLAVEFRFAVNIGGIILGGKIDRLDKLEDGVSIVDYKTNQNLFTVDHLEQDLQLTFYQLAVETLWKMPVKRLTLYHLRSNTPCSCEGRKPERLEEARQIILDVADGIKQEIFPARENQFCDFCDFPGHCPYRKHKFAPEDPALSETGNILQGKAASEAVERYASLQGQKKELELQLEELKCLICEYCQSQGFNRLYGENHTLTYKMVERTDFNADRVKAFLEPIGLWPQVLQFDSARVKALLEGKGIKPEWRNKLAEMKEVTSTFPMLSLKNIKDNEGHIDQ